MNLIDSEQFGHEGKDYDIRISGSGWDISVRAYLDGKPANGYSYHVSLPTAIDLRTVHKLDAVQLLIQHAKRDIIDKVWEQYVDAHVASLKKSPEESLGCRKCGSREITAAVVDERTMYECRQCANIWYDPRRLTNGALTIIDDITAGVEENGSHEIDESILLNCVFRPRDGAGLSFEDQLENWKIQNRLQSQRVREAKRQLIRFWR